MRINAENVENCLKELKLHGLVAAAGKKNGLEEYALTDEAMRLIR